MPGGDGTGPRGLGSESGWGLGPCGTGMRRSYGRCIGYSRGFGFRRFGFIPVQAPVQQGYNTREYLEQELKNLEQEEKKLQLEKEEIKKKIDLL